MTKFDIRDHEEVIEVLNNILSVKGIAEVKFEHGTLTVVEIKRTLKTPKNEQDR